MANDLKSTVYYVTQTRWLGGDDWANLTFVGTTLEESQAKALAAENGNLQMLWEELEEYEPGQAPFVPYLSLEAMQDAEDEFYYETNAS